MNTLCNVEANLPPGFRFYPRDEELICDYLMNWVAGLDHNFPVITKVELNKCEPWEIPETACVGGKDWYFYCLRDRKYATGVRTNRATMSGYWKATGKDRPISRKGIQVGMRKTLVFYQGRAPKGRKTDWVMHEFRLEEGPLGPGVNPAEPTVKEDWVLCRVFKKRSDISSKQQPPVDDLPSPSSSTDHYAALHHRTAAVHHREQVPCFSILTPSQPNPGFSPFTAQPLSQPDAAKFLPHFGAYTASSALSSGDPAPCNIWEIRSVFNHYAKREASLDHQGAGIYESGEGSCDSYLSEADLSSMWNQY